LFSQPTASAMQTRPNDNNSDSLKF
jgi:hypothetical protein